MANTRSRAAAPSDTLTVACKLPQGLHIKVPGTKIDIKLHGSTGPFAVAGHGMTRGVSKAEWDKVKEVFAEQLWLKDEFVFAMKSPESATDKAEDREEVRAGFEPVDPKNPNAMPGMGAIAPDDTPVGAQ